MLFYVHKVEKLNWRTRNYFMSAKWKSLTVRHVHEVEKFSLRTLLYFTSTKWKSLTGELYDTS